ncbi:MAG: hypothetical protein QM690_03220 [Sphingobium sp.]
MLADNHAIRAGLPSWRHAGYSFSYRPGEANHCPGCGRHNWIVGRLMAECAFCGTALILEHIHGYGARQRICRQGMAYDGAPPELQAVA